jgi:hypothetical protein
MGWLFVVRKVVHKPRRARMGTCVARRSRRQLVNNFPRGLALVVSLFWALGFRAEKGDVIGAISAIAGMLLCVGCLVAKAYPQDFDSPIDLTPVSDRALDDFGQVHLIPQRTSGAGLQVSPPPRPKPQCPERMRCGFHGGRCRVWVIFI